MNTAEEYLKMIIEGLVDYPEDIKIDRTTDDIGTLLTLTVNPVDMGRIIGREGSTAKAIRTILRTAGAKNDARVNLKIAEPEGGHSSSDASMFGR